ncbi:MAG: hypothetical protein AAGE99_01110 [Chlamydiota bacterium]
MKRFKDRRLAPLTVSVVAVHLFFFLLDFKGEKRSPPPKKSLVVHTFTAAAGRQSTLSSRTEKASSLKKVEPNRPANKIERLKRCRTAKKKIVLKELEEALKKIERGVASEPNGLLSCPQTIETLQVDRSEGLEPSDYFTLLAQTLKEELEFPEYGAVRLELTVHSSGRVLKIEFLEAASEKNREYLELNLPKVILPPLNRGFKHERTRRFTFTLCNET